MNRNWTIYAKKIAILESLYVPKVRKALEAQIKLFVSDLKASGKDVAITNLNSQLFQGDMLTTLQSIYSKGGLMGAKITNAELKAAVRVEQKAANFGRNADWIQAVLDYLNKYGLQFVQNISDTTKDWILSILQKGIDNGWSLEEIVKQLTRSDYTAARARLIARTEIVRAANVGHAAGARSAPYEVNKQWIAAADHRTRHSHQHIHKQTIDEDGLFKVEVYRGETLIGYEDMSAPGDAQASPSNTINCRCRIIHIPKRDSNDKLILRQPNQARIIPLRTSTVQSNDIRRAIAASVKMDVHLD